MWETHARRNFCSFCDTPLPTANFFFFFQKSCSSLNCKIKFSQKRLFFPSFCQITKLVTNKTMKYNNFQDCHFNKNLWRFVLSFYVGSSGLFPRKNVALVSITYFIEQIHVNWKKSFFASTAEVNPCEVQ